MPNLGPDILGYHIFCWSNENTPLEPVHIHIAKIQQPNATKVWILSDGTTQIESNGSMIPEKTLRRICKFIEKRPFSYVKKWEKHFKTTATYIDKQ